MNNEKINIGIAFILNLGFAVFELIGGIFSGSIAILSDSVHDLGDALSIGISFMLEKKSEKKPDAIHTFGYKRYSVLGGFITTIILVVGSILVVWQSINRLFNPTEIIYNRMIILAIIGVVVNLVAAFVTHHGDSINQRAVNLHMLEDVLGWIVVLIGSIIMRFTDISIIDPLMSIGVSIFVFVEAAKNLREILNIFLDKAPDGINAKEISDMLCKIPNVIAIQELHLWSLDGKTNYATVKLLSDAPNSQIKENLRKELASLGFAYSTIEIETLDEKM